MSESATPCLTVVVPVFNEEATIADVLRTVLRQPLVREVIAVDDGSGDKTWDSLQGVARADGRVRALRS